MMNRMKRLLLIAVATVSLSGCATPQNSVDPRTMTFPALRFEIPKSERLQLANGMVVYLLEDHELPLVSMTAYINSGSIYEPAEKTGLAGLTGAVMRSGGTKETPPEKLDAEL
jgi:zinc protease